MFVNPLSKEAVLITLYNNISDDQFKFNNSWEQSARPKDIKGGGGIAATAEMVDLFPMADGKKPSESSLSYDPLKFYKDRDPRFYRTFAFNGVCWPYNTNKTYTVWNYQWFKDAAAAVEGKPGNSALYDGDVSSSIFVRNVRIRMLTILPISVAEYFRRVVVRIWKYVWRKLFLT